MEGWQLRQVVACNIGNELGENFDAGKENTGNANSLDGGSGNTKPEFRAVACTSESLAVSYGTDATLFGFGGRKPQHLSLGSTVKSMCFASGSGVVAIGTDDGVLHFVSLKSWEVLVAQQLPSAILFMQFVCAEEDDLLYDSETIGQDLIMICANNMILRLSNLGLELLQGAAESENKALLRSVKASVSIWSKDASDAVDHARGLAVHRDGASGLVQSIVGSASGRLSVWIGRDDLGKELRRDALAVEGQAGSDGLRAMATVANHQLLITVHENGRVLAWDARKLFVLSVISLPLFDEAREEDIESEPGSDAEGEHALESDDYPIDIVSYGKATQVGLLFRSGRLAVIQIGLVRPGKCLYVSPASAAVPPGSFLAAGSALDKVYVVGKLQDKLCALECGESKPEAIFEAYLRARRYDEALAMTETQSGLKAFHVYKSQIMDIIAKQDDQLEVEALCNLLDKIASPEHMGFIVSGTLNKVVLKDADEARTLFNKVLELCRQHNSASIEPVEAALYRLDTFCMLGGATSEIGTLDMGFDAFRRQSLYELLEGQLAHARFDVASVLLQRHQFQNMDVARLLERIPLETPVGVYARWIRDQANVLIQDKQAVAQWALDRVTQLEGTPKDALKLAKHVLDFVVDRRDQVQKAPQLLLSVSGQASSVTRTLREVARDLSEIIFLSDEHQVKISLGEFQRLSKENILLVMLDRVMAPELVNDQVTKHLVPCASRYGLYIDQVLLAYIERAAVEIDGADSAREQCAVQIVWAVKDLGIRSEAVLALMRNISPPYSGELTSLVDEALGWATDVQEELHKQKRIMDLAALVARFRIKKRLNFSDPNQARALLQFVLAQGTDDSYLEDALEIAKAYQYIDLADVYATVLENFVLVEGENVDQLEVTVSRILARAPKQAKLRIIAFCELCCSDPFEDDRALILRAARVAVCTGAQHTFVIIRDMLQEFDILLRLQDVESKDALEICYTMHVLEKCHELSEAELFRRAAILGYTDTSQVYSQLASVAVSKLNNSELCVSFLDKIAQSKADLGIKSVVELSVRFPSMHGKAHQHLIKAATFCPPQKLPGIVELLRFFTLAGQMLTRATAADDDSLWSMPGDGEKHEELNMGMLGRNFFAESGSVLSQDAVLPLLRKLLFVLHTKRGDPAIVAEDLVQYLVQNGAMQLALQLLVVAGVRLESQQDCLKRLVSKVLCSPSLDVPLGLGYLLALKHEEAAFACFRESLPTVKRDYARLSQVALLGVDLGKVRGMADLQRDCERMAKNAHWWDWLGKIGVEFDHANFVARGDSELETRQLIQKDLLKPAVKAVVSRKDDVTKAIDFGLAYGIEKSMIHALVIQVLLTKAEDEPQEALCFKLARDVPVSFLHQIIERSWRKLPGHNYRALRTGAKLLEQKGTRAIQVLDLLEACEEFAFPELAPAVKLERVNLHELWKPTLWEAAIEPILFPATIKWLVALSDPLGLDPDDFYVRMVQKLMASNGTLGSSSSVLQYTMYMSNKRRAVDLCEWVAAKCASSASKITVLQYALQIQPESQGTLAKLNDLLTSQDLAQIGYTNEANLQGELLIEDLYEKYAAVASAEWQDPDRLHKVVGGISSRFGLDVFKMRKTFALKWLAQNSMDEDRDGAQRLGKEHALVERIVFLIRPNIDTVADTQRAVHFLLTYAFQKDGPCVTYAARARAAMSIFALATEEEIASTSSRTVEEIRDHLRYCLYMVDFEELRLPHTFEQLVKCDKLGLINGLWRDFRQEPRIVRLVADLIVDFQIDDDKIIQAVLSQMNHLALYTTALTYIDIIIVRGVTNATAVKEPFINAVQGLAEREPNTLVDTFERVRSILVKLPSMDVIDYQKIVTSIANVDQASAREAVRAVIDQTKRTPLLALIGPESTS